MTGPTTPIPARALLGTLLVVVPACLLPVVVAGSWEWWEGWAFAALLFGNFVVSRALLVHWNPGLAGERGRSFAAPNAEPWDRVLAPILALGGTLIGVTAGLEIRFGASPGFPLPFQAGALCLFLAGLVLGNWAMLANPFFSGVVRIQSERGHRVVSAGPYRWLRHPGYAATLLAFAALPVFLDSARALAPAACLVAVGVARTALEDRFLQGELDGYREYAARVRYRLVPGIW
ncbi:MAG: isoprenylcysteine carboxylmethyltransferase family protein [Methanospirillum sp.]|nr:isoprenylcysteine carboxylmethyltransferase family protein [Methanospirillum sp.]